MPMIRVPNAGAVGLIKDLSQHELPINAWTDASNIRFLNGYAWMFYGYGQVYNTASVVPYHVLPVNLADGTRYWVYASLTALYGVANTAGVAVHTDLSSTTYGATANSWTSTVLGGLPIVNNAVNAPLSWNLSVASNFATLSNWPADTTCKALRGFRNFLVAMGVTESGTYYPYLIRTSHPADPGAVPSSWDHTDATKDTLRFDLAKAKTPIVDGCELGDALIVGTETELFRLDYIGGQFVSKATKVLGTSGAMNRNCMVELDGSMFIMTPSDVIMHDGQQARSVLDKVARRWLFQNIDADYRHLCFVFKHPFYNEAYACFPSIGSTSCDMALAYNYDENTCSPRALPGIFHAANGQVDNSLSSTWSSDGASWASDLTAWNDYNPAINRVMMGGTGPKLYLLDSSADFDGSLPTAYLERRGLSFDLPEQRKLVSEIRPRIVGNTGETVIIKVGSQADPWEEPVWQTRTHTIGSTVSNSFLVDGRYIAIRFESGTAFQWRLDSYDALVEPSGPY